jgi:hypothetical protein
MLNYLFAKLTGVSSVDESCRDSVLVFLTKHDIERPSFSFVKGERTDTNPRFNMRVYFGSGFRAQQKVSFLLNVSEDLAFTIAASLVKDIDRAHIERVRREWIRSGDSFIGLYRTVRDSLGGESEKLEIVD